MSEYDPKELDDLIKSGDVEKIKQYMQEHNLVLDGNVIRPTDDVAEEYKSQQKFWDQRQLARKILLNSLYGALLNESMRFYDPRIGQSVTLTGRCIAKHMAAKTNELITGEYNYKGKGIVYGDTDSVADNTIVETNIGSMTISNLFDLCTIKWNVGNKEYSVDDKVKVLSYNHDTKQPQMMPISYVYRHKVAKHKWKILDENGNEIIVTDDHSLMVERNNSLIEVKPSELKEDDVLITIRKD